MGTFAKRNKILGTEAWKTNIPLSSDPYLIFFPFNFQIEKFEPDLCHDDTETARAQQVYIIDLIISFIIKSMVYIHDRGVSEILLSE